MILPKEVSGILLQGGSTSPTPVQLNNLVAQPVGYRVNGKDYCADLKEANLSSALLGCSDVGGEVISQGTRVCANLSGAKNLTQQQLDQVYTCQGATLPQGLTCNRTGSG